MFNLYTYGEIWKFASNMLLNGGLLDQGNILVVRLLYNWNKVMTLLGI